MSTFGKKIVGRLQNFVDQAKEVKNLADSFTCHTVTLDLQPQQYGPDDIVGVRKSMGSSQAVFARFLGVSRNTVSSWEQGINIPSPIACRFMDEIRLNPSYWQQRLRASATIKKPSNA